MKRKQLTGRIRLISAVVALVGLFMIGRLYQLQIVDAAKFQEKAERQYVHTTADLYSRGSIYFVTKDGEYLSAAAIQSGFILATNPTHVTDREGFCRELQPFYTITFERCVERLSIPNRTYVELADTLSAEQAEEVEKKDVPGALLYKNQWRYYPGGSVAARSIGFVAYSGEGEDDQLRGMYGLERHYDDILFRDREVLSVNFFAELFSNIGEYIKPTNTTPSGDIVTTLEPAVSRLLDSVLQETNDRYRSKFTGAIIMDPNTGAIYAMNAVPGFDLNDRSTATVEEFRNPLVENVYEFGSTIKALTIASGLDSGAITRNSTFYDSGSVTLNQFTIRNFDGKGRGTVDMQQALNQSLNTGMAHIVSEMGKERFRDYFISMGLGEKTGIDLPNETTGLISNLQSPRDVEYATASFGQGIALTPIATIRALAALANGGTLVTPHLVRQIEYDDGTVKDVTPPVGKAVLKESTSEEISRMLTTVVDDALRGGGVALPNHSIGAKTGTAQIADPVNGGYYDDKYLHSFFGYFPAYEPRFIVFMYTVEPQGVQYASETLTDPFMDIARFLINYYSIPPDR